MLSRKEQHLNISNLITNRDYNKYKPYFIRTLYLTRLPFFKRNALFMAGMQLGMLTALSKLEEAVRRGKSLLETEKEEKQKILLERALKINLELIRVLKTIADGVAWRSLDFNRPIIRLFSENDAPGPINADYAGWKRALQTRDFVLINDLTRCLRIADITKISKDKKIILYEIKRDGKKFKHLGSILKETQKHKRWFSRQEFRQWITQMAIIENKIKIPIVADGKIKQEVEIEILNLDFQIKNHFNSLKGLIRKAEKEGFVHISLEDGYFVSIHDFESMSKNGAEELRKNGENMKKDFDNKRPEWTKDSRVNKIVISSYDAFLRDGNEYPRNFTPASILPFRARDCVKIMMGHLSISVWFNLDYLEKRITDQGWTIDKKNTPLDFTKGALNQKDKIGTKLEDYGHDKEMSLFFLSKQKDNKFYQTSIPFVELFIVLTSFYKTDFILDALNSLYLQDRSGKPRGQKTITMRFTRENEILR